VALWRKAGVFEAADIREWRGHDVVDPRGHKIGELEAVYVDTGTDLPSYGTVKVGLPTRHRLVFVPLDRATVGPGYLKVSYDKKLVKDAPSIGTEGELPAGSPSGEVDHQFIHSIYFDDPNGHVMEIITRPYGDRPSMIRAPPLSALCAANPSALDSMLPLPVIACY